MRNTRFLPALLIVISAAPSAPVGRSATNADIASENLTVFADGSGLPAGSGTALQGRPIFEAQCSTCHGSRGEGSTVYPALVGGRGTLASAQPVLTVGSYWPYAPTVFDFIRRAMPYYRPGTLTSNQVYALTAYILRLNGIASDTAVMDRRTLPLVQMPNRDGFIADSRPDVP